MTAIIFANDTWYILTFRRPLIQRLSKLGVNVIVVSGDSEYASEIEAAGAEFVQIAFEPRSFAPVDTLRSILAFAGVMRRVRPAHLITFNPKANLVASAANLAFRAQQIANISGFGTIGNLAKDPTKNALLRSFFGAVGNWMAKAPCVCLVQNAADFKKAKDVRTQRRQTLRVMGSGVDLVSFTFNRRSWGTRRTLFAGRFLAAKGIGSFIDIASELNNATTPFALAGRPVDGPGGLSEAEVKARIDGTSITYLGEITDMPVQLAQTHVFVLPSVYGEGIPRTLIEAAASGCVLVAYDIDGVREIIHHEVNGLLVAPGDEVALRAAVEILLNAPEAQLAAMSQASRQLAEREFSEEVILELYAELVVGFAKRKGEN